MIHLSLQKNQNMESGMYKNGLFWLNDAQWGRLEGFIVLPMVRIGLMIDGSLAE
jgi:hypothetical protein